MKRFKSIKLLTLMLLTMAFLIPAGSYKPMAAEEKFLLIDDTLSDNENGRQEYTYVAAPDIIVDIPIYGPSDSEEESYDSYHMFSVYSSVNTDALYGYSTLSDTIKGYYNTIDNAFNQFMDGDYKTKNFSVGTEKYVTAFGVEQNGAGINDLMKAYWAYRHDHPEYYWISSYFSYSHNASGALVYVMIDSSYAAASYRAECETLITNKLQEYITEANKHSSDYDKIRAVHDKIIHAVDYAYNSSGKPESSIWAHNVIGLFNERGVVCEGYAKGFQLILNNLGIKNVYVVGNAGEAHAWNYVCIDGKYYAVDVTWDDIGVNRYGGISYQYFCIPGNYFKSSHTASTTSGNPLSGKWLYTLPELQNGMENTYYYKHNAIAANINSSTIADFIASARAAASGDYVHILSDSISLNNVASALGVSSYMPISKYGSYTALIIVEELKVVNPATSISLSCSMMNNGKIEIDRDTFTGNINLTATLNQGSDDRIIWSSSTSIVKISGSGTSVTLIPKRNGEAVITAKAAKGNITASCTIIITGSSVSENMYLDSECTQEIAEDDITVWVNGGNVKKDNVKTNYKKTQIYTDLTPSKIVTVNSKGITSTKNGKLVVGITMTDEEPVLSKGKIVDTEATKIAKATIKNGIITITANKQSGTVYVWVIDTGNEGGTAYTQINVKLSPSKISIIEEPDMTTAFKKITIPVGEWDMLYLLPTIDKNGTVTNDADYYVTPAVKTASCIEIDKMGDNEFRFTAKGLLNNKATKVKLTAYCNQNTKKAALTVTINNPVYAISPTVSALSFLKNKDTIDVMINEISYSNEYPTTMKPTIYMMTEPNLILDSKLKLQGIKAKDITAKLSSDKKSFTMTLKKNPEAVLTDHHVYVLFKEGKECKLFYIGYIDKDTLVFNASN